MVLGARPDISISVRSVEFGDALLPGLPDPHYEIAIRLRGESAGRGADAGAGAFHRDVEVGLEMALAVGRGQSARQDFYRGRAHLAGLAPGDGKTVYFYLPPELVRRDRLSREPAAWRVTLSVAGEVLPQVPGTYSANLREPLAATTFMARMRQEADSNDGLLLPIYLTAFYSAASRRVSESPSFVRVDSASGTGPVAAGASP